MSRARGALVVVLLYAGCVSSAPVSGSTTSVDGSFSVEDNQQGHAEVIESVSYPMTSSPLTYLWCEDTAGLACLRTAAALGAVLVKNPENAPPALFDLEDSSDDCMAAGIPEIGRRLDAAIGLDPTGWRDQSGNRLEASYWPNIYSAAGCVSDVGSPTAKIAASSSATPRLYLVRIWETSGGV
jgi:hypothetical protein